MKIRIRSLEIPAKFIAFDILEAKLIRFKADPGVSVTHTKNPVRDAAAGGDFENDPLRNRYLYLKTFLENNPLRNVELVEQLKPTSHGEVDAMMATMARAGGEGFMVKRLDAPYQAKRGRNWLKLKTWQDAEFTVVKHGETGVGDGYTITIYPSPTSSRTQEVNLGSHEMRAKIKEGSVVEVKFLSKGEDGALRFPSVRRILR